MFLSPILPSNSSYGEISTSQPAKETPNYHTFIEGQNGTSTLKWSERAITHLDHIEEKLEQKLPNFAFQNRIDDIGRTIQKKFSRLNKFNGWLDSNGHGAWYSQLATFLAKLPPRAARNIINLLYSIIKGCFYGAVHPLKGLNRLAKMLVTLCNELTQAQTWSKMGSGIMGASLGQALATGNPLSVIGLGIGGAMIAGGITIGSLKAAVEAEQGYKIQKMAHNLFSQAKALPESFLTGLGMGLIMGGIQRAFANKYIVTNPEEAQRIATKFVEDHHLKPYHQVSLDSSTGNITLHWDHQLYYDGWYEHKASLTLRPNMIPEFIDQGGFTGDTLRLVGHHNPAELQWTYPTS